MWIVAKSGQVEIKTFAEDLIHLASINRLYTKRLDKFSQTLSILMLSVPPNRHCTYTCDLSLGTPGNLDTGYVVCGNRSVPSD